MKHNLFSRFISVLLAVVMLAGLMSMPSLADTVTGTDTAATDNVNITEDDTEVDSAPAALSEEDGEGDKEPADSNESSEPTDDAETTGDVQEPEEGTEDTQEPADTTEGTENAKEPVDTNEGTGEGEADIQNQDEAADIQDQDETSQTVDGQALLDELMAKSDEDLLPAVQSLSDEQVAALEALGGDALSGLLNRLESITAAQDESDEPLAVEDFNSMSAEELYNYLHSLTDDAQYFHVMDSLSEDKLQELDEYIDSVSAGESEEVTTTLDNGIVNFANAAPLAAVTASASTMMKAKARTMTLADSSNPEEENAPFNTQGKDKVKGLEIKKSVTEYNKTTGKGTLTLESYVTGKVQTETKSVPVDIVLVLDQSGSMADPFGDKKVEKYTAQDVNNYDAERGLNNNYYYMKADDGTYYPVTDISSVTNYDPVAGNTSMDDLYDSANGIFSTTYYYYYDGNQYQQVSVTSEQTGGSLWNPTYSYTVYYGNRYNQTTIIDKASASETLDDHNVTLYTRGATTYTYTCQALPGGSATSTGTYGKPPETLYIKKTVSEKALDALMEAVGNFTENVKDDAVDTGSDHRIAIVGYSSNVSTYQNTEILTVDNITEGSSQDNGPNKYYPQGKTMNGVLYNRDGYELAVQNALRDVNNGNDYQVIQNAIGALTAQGGTNTLDGLDMAYDILSAQQSEYGDEYRNGTRKQVVILFTDGETDSDPDDVVQKAHAIKELGATVYTVGIFENANGSIVYDPNSPYMEQGIAYRPYTYNTKSSANKLMHGISSNYPDANEYTNEYTNGRWESFYEPFGNINEHLATNDPDNPYTSYFLSARDTAGLNDVFEQISNQVGGADQTDLDETTVLFDKISDYVSLPEGTTSSDIVVKAVPVNATSGEFDYNNAETLNSSQMVDIENGAISVDGFDYSEYFVGERADGSYAGKKLVVEIPFETSTTTFGGNNIPTNANTSGIYNADGSMCYGNFEVPMVNVPVDYEIAAKDQTIYLTNSADLTKLLDYADKAEGDAFYTPDGVKNAFVNITYTMTDAVSGDTVATLTIPSGTDMSADNAPIWMADEDTPLESVSGLDDCTSYEIDCTVTPVGEVNSLLPGEVATTKEYGSETGTVHILIPQVEVKDTEINLDDSAVIDGTNGNYNNSAEDKWTHKGNDSGAVDEGEGVAPDVTIGYQFVKGSNPNEATTYNPSKDSYFKVTVSVDGVQISDTTNYDVEITPNNHTEACIEPGHDVDMPDDQIEAENSGDNRTDFDFIIHVHSVTGMLTFTKDLSEAVGANKTATFTIKIEEMNEENAVATYYKTLTFTGNETSKIFTMTLPTGTYRITELKTGGYTNGVITGPTGAVEGASNTWKLSMTGLNLKVTNTSNDPTYPNDHETAVNAFTYNDGTSKWSWQSEFRTDKSA